MDAVASADRSSSGPCLARNRAKSGTDVGYADLRERANRSLSTVGRLSIRLSIGGSQELSHGPREIWNCMLRMGAIEAYSPLRFLQVSDGRQHLREVFCIFAVASK